MVLWGKKMQKYVLYDLILVPQWLILPSASFCVHVFVLIFGKPESFFKRNMYSESAVHYTFFLGTGLEAHETEKSLLSWSLCSRETTTTKNQYRGFKDKEGIRW